MTTLFYLFSNVFHIYATYQFSNVFLQKKKESAKSDIVLFTLYYIINSCAYLLFDNRLITILSNIIPFILIFLYYKVSLFKSLLSAFVLCVFSIVVDTAVVAIQSLLNINSVFFDEGFVSNIVLLTLVNIIAKSYFKYSDQIVKLPIMYYITVIFVPLGSIMVGYFVAKDLNVVSLILSVIILLMNIVILYLYDNLVNMFSQQYETDVIEQQNKAYLNQLHLMQESQMKIRFLKHDMKNHIINMQSLLSAEKYDQLACFFTAFAVLDAFDSGNQLANPSDQHQKQCCPVGKCQAGCCAESCRQRAKPADEHARKNGDRSGNDHQDSGDLQKLVTFHFLSSYSLFFAFYRTRCALLATLYVSCAVFSACASRSPAPNGKRIASLLSKKEVDFSPFCLSIFFLSRLSMK